jgi:hypothetical protein
MTMAHAILPLSLITLPTPAAVYTFTAAKDLMRFGPDHAAQAMPMPTTGQACA